MSTSIIYNIQYTLTMTIMKEAAIVFIILLLLLTIISIFGGSVTYVAPRSGIQNTYMESFDEEEEAFEEQEEMFDEKPHEEEGYEDEEHKEGYEDEDTTELFNGNKEKQKPIGAYELEEFASF
jgi:hypothetical protein